MSDKKTFSMKGFIDVLVSIPDRQLESETKAAELIKQTLAAHGVRYQVQKYITWIPRVKKGQLSLDGKTIDTKVVGLHSGVIDSKDAIISSLISSQKNINDANINFNPACAAISRSNHYFAPALAIAPKDVPSLINAKKVKGVVDVVKTRHQSQNILVGNLKNPRHILFCHYDSLGPGAIDNASGTAFLLKLIIDFPETLHNTLYVVAGNEELSYDFPLYWGHGYRVFEKTYLTQMQKAKDIFAVDCVGQSKAVFDNYSSLVKLSFPILNLDKWQKKVYSVYGDFRILMSVYHSDIDTPDLVKDKYLQQTLKHMLTFLT